MSIQISQISSAFKQKFRFPQARDELIEIDNKIARTIFGKWCMDILLLLYVSDQLRFEEIRQSVPRISGKVLSKKLTFLEQRKLIGRTITATKPPRALYQLSEEGLVVVRLVEPVMMFLRQ